MDMGTLILGRFARKLQASEADDDLFRR